MSVIIVTRPITVKQTGLQIYIFSNSKIPNYPIQQDTIIFDKGEFDRILDEALR